MTRKNDKRSGIRLGLAARLYIAIGGAVTLTLLASLVAWISFVEQGKQQASIANRYLPAITISLQLSRQSALIASTAPRLLTVSNDEERLSTLADLADLEAGLIGQLEDLEARLTSRTGDRGDNSPLATVWGESRRLSQTLARLGDTVGSLHILERQLSEQVVRAVAVQRRLGGLITPLVDETTFYMVTGYRSLDDPAPVPLDERIDADALAAFGALAELQAESNLATGLLTEASITPDAALLRPLRERFDASADRFATATANLGAAHDAPEIEAGFQELLELGQGDDNIIDLRTRVIDFTEEAANFADTGRILAARLSANVGRVVEAAQHGTLTAVAATETAAENSQELLLWVNGIAVVGAIFIGWFYVKRSFTRPVLRITAAAEDFESDRFNEDALSITAKRNDELGHLARTFTQMAKEVQARTEILDRMVAERTQQLNEKNLALQRSLSQIADELTIAQRTQLSILPSLLPSVEGLRLFAHMRAAREVGGDFYDVIELDDHRIGIVVADVSDKGVPAALMMAVSYTLIKSTALHEASPAKVLAEVNQALSKDNETMMFVTAFYGIVDVRTGQFTFANAGHDPPLLVRAAEPVSPLPQLGGTALGILSGAEYSEFSLTLQSGDTIVLYTDGVTEAFNGSDEAFSIARLETLLDRIRTLPVDRLCGKVLDSVDEHADGTPQSDDITCVVLRFGSGDGPIGSADPPESSDEAVAELDIDLKPDISEISRLVEAIEGFAKANGLTEETAGLINLVLDEIVSNIINYGCVEERDYHLKISVRLNGRTIEVVVEDDATPFDPLEVDPPDVEASLEDRPIGGMGLHLVRHFTDDISYEHDGSMNRLTLTKLLDG